MYTTPLLLKRFNRGQAAMIAIVFFVFISLVTLGAIAGLGISQLQISNDLLGAKRAYAVAYAALDDGVYRLTQVPNSWRVPENADQIQLNSQTVGTAAITYNPDGFAGSNDFIITAGGSNQGRYRKIKFTGYIPDSALTISLRSAMQMGSLGIHMSATSRLTPVCDGPCAGTGNFLSNGYYLNINDKALEQEISEWVLGK